MLWALVATFSIMAVAGANKVQANHGGLPSSIWVERHLDRTTGACLPQVLGHENPAFETYVAGVLEGEMSGPSWNGLISSGGWPSPALKAQAIAARTWGWRWDQKRLLSNGQRGVWDCESDQVYWPGHSGQQANYNAISNSTAGIWISYTGSVIDAQYRAANGDPTLSGPQPYLASVPDPVEAGTARCCGSLSYGMSQEGAGLWGRNHAVNYSWMLRHYYPGTAIEGLQLARPLRAC